MINALRINEAVASEMKRMGVGRKPVVESEEEHPADEKSAAVQIPHKKGHYQFTFKTSKGKDGKWIRRIYKGEDMSAIHDKAKAKALKDYPESYGHVCHSPQCDESTKASEPKLIKEGEDEKEGLEDKQFDAPTTKEVLDQKPEGTDKGHDEAGEEQDDPTREKLETPQDEKDEMKGGAAELAADLRVSVRIERMNMGRYQKMLSKHELSEDGQAWLKEKIADIQSMIDDMLERIPKLEAEAKEQEGGEEKIKECMRTSLKKAIVEIAAG